MNRIVVSLTTYKDRINTIDCVIDSINKQSVKPDIIVLYLYSKEINIKDLNISNQDNLLIRFVDENLKGHKKYFYAFKEFKDDIVITLDDDVFYHEDTIKKLLEYYEKYPNYVIANRTRFITIKNEKFENYYKWEKNFPENYPSLLLMGTGVLGILYPPYIFDEKLYDKELLIKYALDNDDIWLKIHQLRKGIKTVLTDLNKDINLIDGTQETSLCFDNFKNDGCNKTINALTDIYGIDMKKVFLNEFSSNESDKIYVGLYSTCYKKDSFLIKYMNFNNSPKTEYEINSMIRENIITSRRNFGYCDNPSLMVCDYIKGNFISNDEINFDDYCLILDYINNLQNIKSSVAHTWDKYKNNCIDALLYFDEKCNEEINILNDSKCDTLIHGDLNPNNILLNDNAAYIIDYENSSMGPNWWDKCYLLANYHIDNVDFNILKSLSFNEIQNIILIIKIRIGRLIRKEMDIDNKINILKSWESFLKNYN